MVYFKTEIMRALHEIATEIKQDWKEPYFGAKPYLDAMSQLTSMSDMFWMDSARSIVNYFLANATTWKGKVANRIKKELKEMLK